MWDWLGIKRLEIRKTWLFSWPDASQDKCQVEGCGIERENHGRLLHKFKED